MKRVEHFPADSKTGFIDLISLRNLVPEAIREIEVLRSRQAQRSRWVLRISLWRWRGLWLSRPFLFGPYPVAAVFIDAQKAHAPHAGLYSDAFDKGVEMRAERVPIEYPLPYQAINEPTRYFRCLRTCHETFTVIPFNGGISVITRRESMSVESVPYNASGAAHGDHPSDEHDNLDADADFPAAEPESVMASLVALGVVGVGVAVVEAALLPAVLLGAAAVAAPKIMPRAFSLLDPLFTTAVRGAYKVGQRAREAMAEAQERVNDIVAEVDAEAAQAAEGEMEYPPHHATPDAPHPEHNDVHGSQAHQAPANFAGKPASAAPKPAQGVAQRTMG